MTRFYKQIVVVLIATAFLDVSCSFKRKKYENPITKNTQQPDKVLFDKSIKDIEKGRFEIARLTLNTLINTYDTSEFLAKAKLAIADSWYREGGTHGLAQAEAEYKDFILFYPAMEEAAESQKKICDIHFKQMDKEDRDSNNALRAEMECRTLITQFPNSKYVPETEQELRQIQEVLGGEEFTAGEFYHRKGSNPAAANRFGGLVDQYPLYSKSDLALWNQADSYSKMGPRFRQKEGESLARLVKDYPLSRFADAAKKRLSTMEMPIPEADPVAVARMKFEQENRTKPGMLKGTFGFLSSAPDVSMAAKSGSPTMTNPKPSIPASIPSQAVQAGITDVTVAPVTDPTALERLPDARLPNGAAPAEGAAGSKTESPATGAPGATTPAAAGTPATATPAATTPAAGTPAAPDAKAASSTPAQDQTTSPSGKKKKKSNRKNDTKTDTKSDNYKPASKPPNIP